MNINSFYYFLAIEKERSFTKAAQTLYVSQQALSANISALEHELNCQLFIRQTPLLLTEAGQMFLEHAKIFESHMDALAQDFERISKQLSENLKVGVTQTLSKIVMPPIIENFRKIYPNIQVNVVIMPHEKIQEALQSGSIDVGIAHFPSDASKLILNEFFSINRLMLVPVALYKKNQAVFHQIASGAALELLAPFPFLLQYSSSSAGKEILRILKSAGFEPSVAAQANDIETLLSLCILGTGICFCDEHIVMTTLTGKELKRVKALPVPQLNKTPDVISVGRLKTPYPGSIAENSSIMDAFLNTVETTYYPRKN